MSLAIIIALLLIALGMLWGRRIADRNNDGDIGAALVVVLIVVLGIAILVVTLLYELAIHVHWGWP